MFLKNLVLFGGMDNMVLNHFWHGIDFLLVLECSLLATLICMLTAIWPRKMQRKLRIAAFFGTVFFATAAWAASSTLSNLSAVSSVGGTDTYYTVQTPGSGGLKATANQLKTFVNTGGVDARTTTVEAITNSDQNKLVTFSNAGAVAASIAQAGGAGNFTAGWAVSLKNLGVGTVTLTATTSTIDGSGTPVTLTTGQGFDLYSDGTNYFTQPGKASGGSGTVTTTGTPANGNLAQFSGATSITNGNISGDCVTSGALAVTCNGMHPGYNTTNWYLPQGHTTLGGGGASTANRIMCSLGYIPNKVTIGSLGVRINTLGSSNIQLALYSNASNSPTTPSFVPGTLLSSTANIVDTATGFVSAALGASQQVGPGSTNGPYVWFCFNAGDSTVALSGWVGSSPLESSLMGAATGLNAIGIGTTAIVGKLCTAAACTGGSSNLGTWPADLHASTFTDATSAIATAIAFQASSVP